MKFNTRYRPELLAFRGITRPHLSCVWLDAEKQRLVATNGHAIVALPCTAEDGDKTGALTPATLRAARARSIRGEAKVKARTKLADTGESIHHRPQVAYPAWTTVIDPGFKRGDAGTVTFGVNPMLLMAIAQASGASMIGNGPLLSLTVKIPEKGKDMIDPILVRLEYGSNAEQAICMPARVDK